MSEDIQLWFESIERPNIRVNIPSKNNNTENV